MKEGWEYKKLGEVCNTSSGGTPSKSHMEYYEGGTIPWLRSGEVAQGLIYSTELCITDLGMKNSSAKLFPIDTVVIAMYGATVGQVGILKKEMTTNQAICGVFPNKIFYPMFLFYCLKAKKSFFIKDAVGGAQPNISQNLIKKTEVPVPPLAEQHHIVEELDLLSSVIEKKKIQLNELDNLAQSLFYEMFGDPISNEKGWEVRKLNDIYKLKSGDGLSAKNFVEGIYPVYGGNGISGYHNAYNMNGDFIIIGRVGAYCGNVRYVKGLFWLTDNAFQLFFDANIQTPVFVLYLLTLLDLHRFANEAAQPVISNKTLRDLDIIIPTMEMQEQFASKIEAIEHQKELIKQSIKEVETLFNSRMDYYFN